MSFLPGVRQSGLVFRNAGNLPEDMLVTLKKSGVNVIRLRLWKDPAGANSDFSTVRSLSEEIRNAGLKVMISVHYSDTWADPSRQTKPAGWEGIPFEQLKDSVYAYTRKIATEINPEYIQIGNEINNGFLWPEGSISNTLQMKQLLREGVRAVRESDTTIKVVIHYAGFDAAPSFFSVISDLDYDLIGISYYPLWHGKSLDSLKQSLSDLSGTFQKPVFIAETSYPFTLGWNDWTNNVIGLESQILPQYPPTPQGQREYLLKIKELVTDIPGCIGFCYWGGEWVSYRGNNATDGSAWENQAFWDFDNKSLPVLECYRAQMK